MIYNTFPRKIDQTDPLIIGHWLDTKDGSLLCFHQSVITRCSTVIHHYLDIEGNTREYSHEFWLQLVRGGAIRKVAKMQQRKSAQKKNQLA